MPNFSRAWLGDHAKYIKDCMKYGISIYASDEVSSEVEKIFGEKVVGIPRMRKKQLGGFQVIPFHVPHNDTECDGFLISHQEIGSLLFITDAEYCPYDFSKMGITHAMVECNYSEDYISHAEDSGKFEHVLRGHLELQTCKRLIETINSTSLRSIGLLHLSGGNADAGRFRDEIEQLVDCDVNVYVAEKGLETEFSLCPF